jgi:hypothetical protein
MMPLRKANYKETCNLGETIIRRPQAQGAGIRVGYIDSHGI